MTNERINGPQTDLRDLIEGEVRTHFGYLTQDPSKKGERIQDISKELLRSVHQIGRGYPVKIGPEKPQPEKTVLLDDKGQPIDFKNEPVTLEVNGKEKKLDIATLNQLIREALEVYICDPSGDEKIRRRIYKEGPKFLEDNVYDSQHDSQNGEAMETGGCLQGTIMRRTAEFMFVNASTPNGKKTYYVPIAGMKIGFRAGDRITIIPTGVKRGGEKPEAKLVD